MELLTIELVQGQPPVLRVDGEIDLSTSEKFRTALEEALATHPRLVVDMGGVTFFDATGIRALLQAAESLNGGGPLQICSCAHLARVLHLVGLTDLTSVHLQEVAAPNAR
jgi:anti-anti-sigma factor